MAYGNIKQLASYTLHATESIVYSAPISKSVEIATIWLHNSSTSNVSATMWFPFTATIPTASFSASAVIQRLNETITGSATLEISPKVPFVLNSSGTNYVDKITMKAGATGSMNVIIYGREDS
jgi:hypothetical protein